MVKDLLDINREQQARVDKLVNLLEKTSITPSPEALLGVPGGGGVPFTLANRGQTNKQTALPTTQTGFPAVTSVSAAARGIQLRPELHDQHVQGSN